MSPALSNYVIVAWVVLSVVALPAYPIRQRLLVILLSGMLFLPQVESDAVELGPIKFTKSNSVCYALLICCLVYDSRRLFASTPTWSDVPALFWAICPAISLLLNDPPPDGSLPLRDAASQTFSHDVRYLIPYLIGRLYFSNSEGMRELAAATVFGALVYAPFCLYEVRFSPQLHAIVYGFMQHDFLQHIRFGGYRPMVFMAHGLVVGLFMASATVLAAWTRPLERHAVAWRRWAFWGLAPTLVLCKSTAAIILAAVGVGLVALAQTRAMRIAIFLLAAIPPVYCVARTVGWWSGNELVQLSSENIDEDRARSLDFRLDQENQLIDRALLKPAFGWGGWGRNRIRNEEDKDISITDGIWIIFMGTYGIVGLTSFGAMILLPVFRYARLVPHGCWISPPYASATASAVVLELWCIDCLPNSTTIPMFFVMVGSLTGFTPGLITTKR